MNVEDVTKRSLLDWLKLISTALYGSILLLNDYKTMPCYLVLQTRVTHAQAPRIG